MSGSEDKDTDDTCDRINDRRDIIMKACRLYDTAFSTPEYEFFIGPGMSVITYEAKAYGALLKNDVGKGTGNPKDPYTFPEDGKRFRRRV